MWRRLLSIARASRILLVLALLAYLLPTVSAFTDGQAASPVLGQSDFTSSTPATTASGMRYPSGVAVDPTSSKVFVTDSVNQRVLRFASSAALVSGAAADGVLGQSDFTSNTSATTASGMRNPTGVAVDSAGHLWVADSNNNRVLRFDGAAGKPNGAAANGVLDEATFGSRMDFSSGVAVDSAGRLWVADSNNSRVLRFDGAAGKPNGAAADGVLGQSDFTSNTFATTASGMRLPWGVAVDSASNLWVADNNNVRVLRFDGPIVPTLTWATPAAITYGTPLSAAQLNASAPVPGSFSYSPPVGTVLNAGAGQTLSVLFTPTDTANYTSATTTVTIDVNQATQTISFGALANKTVGDAPISVSATASSGLAVSFSSTTPSVCTVSGNTITLLAAGTCTITADQAGDTNYHAAPQVSQSFSVAPAQFRTYLPLIIR